MSKSRRPHSVSIETKTRSSGEYLIIKIQTPPRILHVGAQLEAQLPGFIGFRPHFERLVEAGLTQYLHYFDRSLGQVCALASAAFEKQSTNALHSETDSAPIQLSEGGEDTYALER